MPHDARLSSARASPRWPRRTPRRARTSRSSTQIVASGIERNISLKLTQLGLDVDRATCVDNLRRILERAAPRELLRPHRHGELAATPQVTLDIFETLWQQGYRNIGVVLQSDLPRSEADVRG